VGTIAAGQGNVALKLVADAGMAKLNAIEFRQFQNVYLYLIMIIECYYRRYETNKQEMWARDKLVQEMAKLDGS
jgi:hypothetical protein